jgi:predicted phosphodiesterase
MIDPTVTKYKTPVIKKDQPDDTHKFQPLPVPTGNYPYHLSLGDVLPEVSDQTMAFHMVGDTGSIRNPGFQRLVTGAMAMQYDTASKVHQPQFLYHLGDVVYNFGEAERYCDQFFKPYEQYPGPIMAIAGNHDSDINPDNPVPYKSLDAFIAVFCDIAPKPVAFSCNAERKSMTQPNTYWTLETPLATIIGLHGNAPRYGVITNEQRAWFIEELKNAATEKGHKMLIVCLHHAPYSADTNHGSSLPMIEFLEGAFSETGIRPDIIFSGHVHNYQRFSKRYTDGTTVPYVVAGGGGYDELHAIASVDDVRFTNDNALFDGVHLECYCDTKHGFLQITIERKRTELTLTGEYYTLSHEEPADKPPTAIPTDRFKITRSSFRNDL